MNRKRDFARIEAKERAAERKAVRRAERKARQAQHKVGPRDRLVLPVTHDAREK